MRKKDVLGFSVFYLVLEIFRFLTYAIKYRLMYLLLLGAGIAGEPPMSEY